MQKSVLITGCSGQLGYRLCMDLDSKFNVIPTYKKHKDQNKRLDLTNNNDFEHIFSIYKPDIIINCAALTNLEYCENNKKECREINVTGLSKLISFSDVNSKIIHISSDYVFDGVKGAYREDHPTHPINYYGKSKLESENILIGSNRDYIIFRSSMLFDDFNNNFFTWVLNSFKNKNKIKVATDMISNPTWVPLLSNVIMKSIYLNISGSFHYGSDSPISRFEFSRLIANKFNLSDKFIIPVKSSEIGFKVNRPKNTGLISKKISTTIDVELYSIDYMLKLLSKI